MMSVNKLKLYELQLLAYKMAHVIYKLHILNAKLAVIVIFQFYSLEADYDNWYQPVRSMELYWYM